MSPKFFLETSPIYYVLTMHFKPLNIFQLTNSIYIHITRWLQLKMDFVSPPPPPPHQGDVGPLHFKNAYIKLPPLMLKYVCRIYDEDIIISKHCLFWSFFTSFYVQRLFIQIRFLKFV